MFIFYDKFHLWIKSSGVNKLKNGIVITEYVHKHLTCICISLLGAHLTKLIFPGADLTMVLFLRGGGGWGGWGGGGWGGGGDMTKILFSGDRFGKGPNCRGFLHTKSFLTSNDKVIIPSTQVTWGFIHTYQQFFLKKKLYPSLWFLDMKQD